MKDNILFQIFIGFLVMGSFIVAAGYLAMNINADIKKKEYIDSLKKEELRLQIKLLKRELNNN